MGPNAPSRFNEDRTGAEIRQPPSGHFIRPALAFDRQQIVEKMFVALHHIEIDRSSPAKQPIEKGGDDLRQFAAFHSIRIVAFHEAFASRVDQLAAMAERKVIGGEFVFLLHNGEGAPQNELHIGQRRPGTIGECMAISANRIDDPARLYIERPTGDDHRPGMKKGFSTSRSETDSPYTPPIGRGDELFDVQPIENLATEIFDLLAQQDHGFLGIELEATYGRHAAAFDPADCTGLFPHNGHPQLLKFLQTRDLIGEVLIQPFLVVGIGAADNELISPFVEIVAWQGCRHDTAAYRRTSCPADISLVDQDDARAFLAGAQRRPTAGQTAADDQYVAV
jgi:hypothetical protein